MNYSLGIRQAVYRAASAAHAADVEVIGHIPRDWWHIQYHNKLRNATFCGAFPGDGWSGGISSAIFAGCIPVIVMDGIQMPFENVLAYPSFSVRIAEVCDTPFTQRRPHPPDKCPSGTQVEVPKLPAILRAISRQQVAKLQEGLARVRSRFGYSSLASNELRISQAPPESTPKSMLYLAKLTADNQEHEDALQTVLRILLYRAALRKREL